MSLLLMHKGKVGMVAGTGIPPTSRRHRPGMFAGCVIHLGILSMIAHSELLRLQPMCATCAALVAIGSATARCKEEMSTSHINAVGFG